MKTAVPRLCVGMAVCALLCGCATSFETPIRKPRRGSTPQPLRVAILPPLIHPDLTPENLKPEKPLYKQLIDGRGVVYTSVNASRDIGLELVSTLTHAGAYQRVFTAADEEDARATGANALLKVTVRDYRTVQLGANRTGFWMLLTSPLMSQYWLRWRTLEARLDWEIHLISLTDGSTLRHKRLKRNYTVPVRSSSGHHFSDKMLSILQNQAAPAFIGELFGLNDNPARAR